MGVSRRNQSKGYYERGRASLVGKDPVLPAHQFGHLKAHFCRHTRREGLDVQVFPPAMSRATSVFFNFVIASCDSIRLALLFQHSAVP